MATYGIYLYSIVEVIWCTPPKRNTMQITSNHCLLFPTEASDKRYNISKIVKMSSWLMSIDVDWCWLMLFGYYVNAQSTLINYYIYIYINDYHILSKNIKEVYYLVITSHGSFNVNNLFCASWRQFRGLDVRRLLRPQREAVPQRMCWL